MKHVTAILAPLQRHLASALKSGGCVDRKDVYPTTELDPEWELVILAAMGFANIDLAQEEDLEDELRPPLGLTGATTCH